MSSGEVSRRNYVKYAGAGVVVVAVAAAGGYYATRPPAITETTTETSAKKWKWGFSPYYIDDDWYRTDVKGAEFYAADRGYDFIVQNPHGNIETQIKDVRNMVSALKIDGLLLTPCDAAVIVDTIEWVKEQGVPVVLTWYDAETEAADFAIITDFDFIGKRMAEEMIAAAQKDNAEIKGKVFIVAGPSGDYQSMTLTNAELGVLNNYPDLEIVKLECPSWGTDEAIKNVVDAYHGHGKPFGLLANNMTTAIGSVEGMRSANIAVTRGQPGHIYTSSFDGNPTIWDDMEAGLIDCFADGPNPHLECLGMDCLAIIKEKGLEALPPVGATVIQDLNKPEGPQSDGTWNFILYGKEHNGVNPWLVAPWAPSQVFSFKGYHSRMLAAGAIVTPDKLAEFKEISWVKLSEAWLM